MTAREQHLLALAVEACWPNGWRILVQTPQCDDCNWWVGCESLGEPDYLHEASGPTLADALAALLRDLGVEVPERPTAEDHASLLIEESAVFMDGGLEVLRGFYRDWPLAVLALLEEGS